MPGIDEFMSQVPVAQLADQLGVGRADRGEDGRGPSTTPVRTGHHQGGAAQAGTTGGLGDVLGGLLGGGRR